MREVIQALRRLGASPLFTVAATVTMAIAIGATASVFGVVDGVLLKAFPYRSADRLLMVWESNPLAHLPEAGLAGPDYLDFRQQTNAFSALAAAAYQELTITGGQQPERVIGAAVTANYLSTLGVTPVLGRGLAPDSSGPPEVVIGYGLWQRRFGGSRSVLGQTLTLDNQPYTIVGVTPAGLAGPDELLTRLVFTGANQADRGDKELGVYGRLKAGVTREGAQRDVETIARRLSQAYPQTNQGWTATVVPVVDQVIGSVRPALLMLLAAAACVLLVGAANLANLFLVRCLGRERETALRTALGATRKRLVGDFLLEAGIIGGVAGSLGVGMAIGGVRVLRALAPTDLPRLSEVTVDGRVIAFCVLISLATVMLVGFAPAWQASRAKLVDVLKQGGRGGGSTHHPLQDALVVLQVAIALVLLIGAGLMVETFDHFRRMDTGFKPENVLTARILLPADQYSTPERQTAFVTRLVDELTARPGIVAASVSSNVPAGEGHDVIGFGIVGDPEPDAAHVPLAIDLAITPDYFRTMGIALRRGRGIAATDDRRATKVAVVDERVARHFFGSRDPIGQRITFIGTPDTMEVVGVAASVKEAGLAEEDRPEVYQSLAQYPRNSLSIAVRESMSERTEMPSVERALANVDATVPMFDIKTMNQRMAQSVGTTRFSSVLAAVFAAVALLLGTVGIYSVLAYVVAQHKREIGVRLALGATHAQVIGGVVRRACALTGVGIAVGLIAAWASTRALAALFVGVGPHDPMIFAAATIVFGLVAIAAASVPAWRTTRVSPVVALTSG